LKYEAAKGSLYVKFMLGCEDDYTYFEDHLGVTDRQRNEPDDDTAHFAGEKYQHMRNLVVVSVDLGN